MSTESLKFAKFDHPRHGSYAYPAAVVDDERLSEEEKREVLNDWKASISRELGNAPDTRRAHESLDEAIGRLAGLRT